MEIFLETKIVVASRNFLPGEIVLEEEPIIFLSDDTLDNAEEYDLPMIMATFEYFMKKLDTDQQTKVLALCGPVSCVSSDVIREFCVPEIQFSPDDETPPRSLTEEEEDIFIAINNLMRLKMFAVEKGKVLYTEVTRFAHSCAANCGYEIVGTKITCRAITAIEKDEEMTISLFGSIDFKSTHERRHKYLQFKEFTPGDDTRQFPCCDTNCPGIMLACQPCNKNEILFTELSYTDVEYVEPYLLPCTVCRGLPPAIYEAAQFALEGNLPVLANGVAHLHNELIHGTNSTQDWDYLLSDFHKIPHRHQLALPILHTIMKIRLHLLLSTARR